MSNTASPLLFPGLLACRDCNLCNGRIRVVPGYGTVPSKIMFVAQSPGKDEAFKGIPLIGKSGQYFTNTLKSLGMDINKFYKTNVNLCHPPGNRKATPAEVRACSKWLLMQIDAVDPDIIVPMGDSAYRVFMPDETSGITQIRGNVFQREVRGRVRYIIPTIHPAWVLRNLQENGLIFRADMNTVKAVYEGRWVPQAKLGFRKTEATWDEILSVCYDPEKRPFGLDFEADSEDARIGEIVGVGVCNTEGNGCYYPFMTGDEMRELMPQLKQALEDPERLKIVSQAKYEKHALLNLGTNMTNYHDTLLMAWIAGDFPLSLKDGIHRAFGIEMIRIDKFAKMGFKREDWRGKQQLSMAEANSEVADLVVEYAAQDPDASLRLYNYLKPILEQRGLWSLYDEVERPLIEIIVKMEREGFGFDPTPLRQIGTDLLTAYGMVLNRIQELTGEFINPNSSQQAARLLYFKQHSYTIPIPSGWTPAKSAYPPTDKVTLGEHIFNPLVRAILTAKAIKKLHGTYIVALPTWTRNGRIYCDQKQTGAGTGRPSVSKPNLQQIPSRKRDDVDIDMEGSAIRRGFVAAPGNFLYTPDLSQIEMRFAAHLSGDPDMIRIITEGADLHNNSAYKMYKVTAEDIEGGKIPAKEWKNMRYLAKTIGFGCLYGLGPQGLLKRTPTLNLTLEEAQGFIDGFYSAYPGLRDWQASVIRFTQQHGYAETILGRRRYFPDIRANDRKYRGEAERGAINLPVQGSAADYFKLCLIAVDDYLTAHPGLHTRMIMQVHDEIVLEGPQEVVDILERDIPPIMSNVLQLRVPVKVDFEYGLSWGDVHDSKYWKEKASVS